MALNHFRKLLAFSVGTLVGAVAPVAASDLAPGSLAAGARQAGLEFVDTVFLALDQSAHGPDPHIIWTSHAALSASNTRRRAIGTSSASTAVSAAVAVAD